MKHKILWHIRRHYFGSLTLVTIQRLASDLSVPVQTVLDACLALVDDGELVESRAFRLRDCNDK